MNTGQAAAARRHGIIVILFATAITVALTTGGCGDQMTRMEQNQVRLQAMIMANARQLATVSSQVDRGEKLNDEAFAKIDQDTQTINTQVRTVQRDQAQLHAALLNGNQEINRKIAQLDRNQAHLKEGVAQVGNIAQKTNAAVGAVARDQATLHRMVHDNKQELAESMTLVAKNQQSTHAGIAELHQADRSLAGKQDALQRLVQNNDRQLAERLTTMSAKQEELDGDLANLHTLTHTVATDVTTLGTEQAALHQTLNANTSTLTEKLALLEQHQLDFQTVIDRVANTTAGTADHVTTLVAGQTTIRKTQNSQYANLSDSLGTVTQNQHNLQASVGALDKKADHTASHLTRLSAGQDALQETIGTNNQATVANLTSLADNQRALRNDIASLADSSEIIASDLDTVITNQSTVQTELAQSKQRFAAFSQNQTALRNDIAAIADKADATSTQISSVTEELTSVHASVKTSHAELIDRAAALTSGQANLSNSIDQVHQVARQTAADQVAMDQTLHTQHDASQEQIAKLTDRQHTMQDRVDTLMATASQLALNTVTMVSRQADFDQDIRSELASLTAGTDQLITGQNDLAQTVQKSDASVSRQIAGLAANQQTLRTDVANVASTTTQIATNVDGLGEGQKQLHQAIDTGVADLTQDTTQLASALDTVGDRQQVMTDTLTAHNESLASHVTHLADGQKNLQGGLDTLSATTTQVALDVITLDDNQARIDGAIQANGQALTTGLNRIGQDQDQMQSGLDNLTTTTTQMALDVLTLDGNQAGIQKILQANAQDVVASMAQAAERQGQIQSGLDNLTATTTQMALDVITLDQNQDTIQKTVAAGNQDTAASLADVAAAQGQIQGGLDTLTATTTQTALDVITLDENQASVAKAVQAGNASTATSLTEVAQRQGQMQNGLDTVTATTTQVALDVITLSENQTRQGQTMQANQQEMASTLSTVAQNQQQTQASLETISTTTGQVAKDVVTLEDSQAKLQEAVAANRQELATKLAEIAQGQQLWLARFDAAQAQVETMTAGITALEQRVSKLQGTLQTSLDDITTLLDAESQQRVQFEESVRQDMQGVADTISQLRQVQAGLAEHIQRMQDSSQSQTGDILTALEQLELRTSTEGSAIDTELQSSNATTPQVVLP